MKPLSQYLTDLIDIVAEAMSRPVARVDRFSRAEFAALAAEIRHAHALPAEGIRCTHAAAAVLELIEGQECVKAGDEAQRRPWLMLIAAALPLLRAEAYQAFLNEKEARGR